jgi:hypothetical protein
MSRLTVSKMDEQLILESINNKRLSKSVISCNPKEKEICEG